ncbi:MAG: hypothetical protein C5B49_01860 [Bdellovibrio sp.]|nr:MAG: hypothetical protein C5B49_01860 [Bdellovibrio sp.]
MIADPDSRFFRRPLIYQGIKTTLSTKQPKTPTKSNKELTNGHKKNEEQKNSAVETTKENKHQKKSADQSF